DRGRREQADLVALTGDFIHSGFHHVEAAARIVGRLEAPLGVYAVLGNHDYAVRNKFGLSRKPKLAEAVRTALEARRIRVLENENVVVRHRKAPLAVAGVADLWSRDCDLPKALAGLTAETPRVLLAHNPFTAESLAGARCDLMLSGHTHGGQISLQRFGRPLLTRPMKNYAAGLYPLRYGAGAGYVYVNKGVGFTVRWRYRARPEIAVLRLTEVVESSPPPADGPAA
ncbi:MAG: metallophosphoesterase, partial [Planctomycetia bacterium]